MTDERRELAQRPTAGPSAHDAAVLDHDPVLAQLALVVPPTPPVPHLRRRLLDAVGRTRRLGRFTDTVATLLGVGRELAVELLDGIDRATSWTPSSWPGVTLYHLEASLAGHAIAAQAVVGFVRVRAGGGFPEHAHVGEETVLVVQGGILDADGTEARPGDVVVRGAGSEHAFVAAPEPDLVYLAIVRDGVRFGELVMRPGSPEV